jgi:hypothetical protein
MFMDIFVVCLSKRNLFRSVSYPVIYYTTIFFSHRLSHFRGQAVVKNFIEM